MFLKVAACMICQWAACVVECCCALTIVDVFVSQSCSELRNKYIFQKKPRGVEKVLEILIIYSHYIYGIVKRQRVLFRGISSRQLIHFALAHNIQNTKNESSPISRCSSPPRKAHPECCCPEEDLRLQGRRLRQRRQAGHAQGCRHPRKGRLCHPWSQGQDRHHRCVSFALTTLQSLTQP